MWIQLGKIDHYASHLEPIGFQILVSSLGVNLWDIINMHLIDYFNGYIQNKCITVMYLNFILFINLKCNQVY